MLTAWVLLAGFLAVTLSPAVRAQGFFSPIRMFMYAWMLVVGVTCTGMVSYHNRLQPVTVVLVLATVGGFVWGAVARTRLLPTGGEGAHANADFDAMDKVVLGILCGLAVVGVVSVFYDLIAGPGRAVLAGLTSLGQISLEWAQELRGGSCSTTCLFGLSFGDN